MTTPKIHSLWVYYKISAYIPRKERWMVEDVLIEQNAHWEGHIIIGFLAHTG